MSAKAATKVDLICFLVMIPLLICVGHLAAKSKIAPSEVYGVFEPVNGKTLHRVFQYENQAQKYVKTYSQNHEYWVEKIILEK